ncbi:MAG: hypothetical protein GY839_09465 [candidate division Zixibacteria bacterium]|nr:hypothetical protein [candidate division Zixibacteria bacterium]
MAESADMGFWEKLLRIDRRWIYLAIGIFVFFPILMNLGLPVYITDEVKAVYDRIDSLSPGTVVMIPCEYDPATMAELRPMAHAVFRHCFAKDLKIVSCALQIEGVTLVKDDLAKIASEYGKTYGEDYVFLGYKPYPAIVILNMGENFRKPFPKDYFRKELDEYPMMKGVINYSSCALIVNINATSGADYWINYANGRYKAPLALGVTAVMATDYYTFLASGQIFGLMGGLKGAAEYEKMIGHSAAATKAMDVQSVAHSVIVLFIILGNIAFFASRKRKKGI